MSTLERLQDLITLSYPGAAHRIDADATLESLGIDSLGVIELLFQVEEAFGITLDADEAARLGTVGEVAAHIDRERARQLGAAPLNGTDIVRSTV